MAQAYAMEIEASRRYAQFAERLEAAAQVGVALLFRRLAQIEAMHADRIVADMGWSGAPALPQTLAWKEGEGPESAPADALYDRIDPPTALAIALQCERKAQRFFEDIVSGTAPESVRAVAAEMAAEEREHARMIEIWIAKTPRPFFGWE